MACIFCSLFQLILDSIVNFSSGFNMDPGLYQISGYPNPIIQYGLLMVLGKIFLILLSYPHTALNVTLIHRASIEKLTPLQECLS